MASKRDFKTVETDSIELEEIDAQVRKHRRKTFGHVVRVLILLAIVMVGVQLWTALRSYSSYEVRSITERQDSKATRLFFPNVSSTATMELFTGGRMRSYCGTSPLK